MCILPVLEQERPLFTGCDEGQEAEAFVYKQNKAIRHIKLVLSSAALSIQH